MGKGPRAVPSPPRGGGYGRGERGTVFFHATWFYFWGVPPSSGTAGFVHPLCTTLPGFSSAPAVGEEEVGEIWLFFFLIDFSPKRKQTGMLVGSCLLQTKAAQPVSPTRDLRAGGRYLRPPPHISGCRPHSSASLLPPSPRWGRKAGKAVPGVEGRDFGAPWVHIKGCFVPTEVPKPRRAPCTSIPSSRPPGYSELLNEINERGRPAHR